MCRFPLLTPQLCKRHLFALCDSLFLPGLIFFIPNGQSSKEDLKRLLIMDSAKLRFFAHCFQTYLCCGLAAPIRDTAQEEPTNIFLMGISCRDEKTGLVNSPAMQPQSPVPREACITPGVGNLRWDHMSGLQIFESILGRGPKQVPIPLCS